MPSLSSLWKMRKTRLFQNMVWAAGGQFTTAVLGLVGLRVLTELVPPAVFGEVSLLMTAMTLGMNVLVAPIQNTQVRYHSHFVERGDGDRFSAEILRRTLLASSLIAVIAVAGFLLWNALGDHDHGWSLAALLALWAPVFAVRNTAMNRLVSERRQPQVTGWLVFEMLATIGLTALFVFRSPTTQMYMAGQLAGTLLVLAGGLALPPRLRRTAWAGPQSALPAETGRLVRAYGLPFMGLAFLNWLGNLVDRYALAILLDTRAVGYYTAAFSIGSRAMLMSGGVITDAFRPALFEAENAGNPDKATRLFWIWLGMVAAIASVASAAIWLFSAEITALLLAADYRDQAGAIMHWIAIGYGLVLVTGVLDNRILSFGVSSKLLWPMAAGAAATLIFCFILIPLNGLPGAAQASALGFGLQMCATALALYRIVSVRRRSAIVKAG